MLDPWETEDAVLAAVAELELGRRPELGEELAFRLAIELNGREESKRVSMLARDVSTVRRAGPVRQ